MSLIELLEVLDVSIGEISLIVIAVLTLIQITPVKINPWSWIARKVGKAINGEVLERVSDLDKKIKELEEKLKAQADKSDRRAAVNNRVRILRFEDELLMGRKHSKDSFDQVMDDITEYNRYCNDNPTFKNNQTAATVAHIEKCYASRLEKQDFL